ncbi:hypothetical protein YC2023_061375 [Brassica napus]
MLQLENLGEIRLVARIVLGLRSDLDIRRLVDDIERIDLLTNETFLYEALSVSRYTLLQPHLDVLLFEIIFPLMCFNNDDQVLWDEDPHDVRKVMKAWKRHFPKFIQFIVGIFNRYGEAPLEQKPYRQKDGALLAVGTLCDKLRQTEPYKSELENMLVQHVFPEFSSPAGHLRAKVLVTAFGCSDPLLIRFC